MRPTPMRPRNTLLRRGTKRLKRTRFKWCRTAGRTELSALQFGRQAELCRGLPCCVCGSAAPSDPHHVVPRSRGGLDCHTVPLCRPGCHDELHRVGAKTFGLRHGVNLIAVAAVLQRRVNE